MRARVPFLCPFFAAALACGGKVEVGGKAVGSCTFAGSEWTCSSQSWQAGDVLSCAQ